MKWLILFCLLGAGAAQAAHPSKAAISSCMAGRALTPAVTVDELPRSRVKIVDSRSGYRALYYFTEGGKDIGYAAKGSRYGILYADDIYLLSSAKRVLGKKVREADFDPYYAAWRKVSDASGLYLCVTFPLGEPGLKSSLQNAAYLLPIGAPRGARSLFFAVARADA